MGFPFDGVVETDAGGALAGKPRDRQAIRSFAAPAPEYAAAAPAPVLASALSAVQHSGAILDTYTQNKTDVRM